MRASFLAALVRSANALWRRELLISGASCLELLLDWPEAEASRASTPAATVAPIWPKSFRRVGLLGVCGNGLPALPVPAALLLTSFIRFAPVKILSQRKVRIEQSCKRSGTYLHSTSMKTNASATRCVLHAGDCTAVWKAAREE